MHKGSNIVIFSKKVIRVITITYLHKKISAFLCLVTLVISGCSTYEQDFDCSPGVGMGCVSISEVNSVVDKSQESSQKGQQALTINAEESSNREDACPTCKVKRAEISASEPPLILSSQTIRNTSTNVSGRVRRTDEKIARIWIAPYEDEEGNFWEKGYVHILLKPSQWNSEAVQ